MLTPSGSKRKKSRSRGSSTKSITDIFRRFLPVAAVVLAWPSQGIGQDYAAGLAAVQSGDYTTALAEWTPLAQAGDARAQFQIAMLYANGMGVAPDQQEAVQWLLRAAEQGNSDAQLNLGMMLDAGRGAARDFAEAARWYAAAAEQGNPIAQLNLGLMYRSGDGVPRDDIRAAQLLRQAAEQGIPEAQSNLGYLHFEGLGVEQSYPEAELWYSLAARQGDIDAQNNLAAMYLTGQGVLQNTQEAMRWYRVAAAQGSIVAQRALAAIYENGEGIAPDTDEAINWYRQAALQGDAFAQAQIDRLAPGNVAAESEALPSPLKQSREGWPIALWVVSGVAVLIFLSRLRREAATKILSPWSEMAPPPKPPVPSTGRVAAQNKTAAPAKPPRSAQSRPQAAPVGPMTAARLDDIVRALNFPNDADDHIALAALERASANRDILELLRIAHQTLTLLAEDGIEFEDLLGRYGVITAQTFADNPPKVYSETDVVTVTARLAHDTAFTDTLRSFIRRFDDFLLGVDWSRFADEMSALAGTRSGQAFSLVIHAWESRQAAPAAP